MRREEHSSSSDLSALLLLALLVGGGLYFAKEKMKLQPADFTNIQCQWEKDL